MMEGDMQTKSSVYLSQSLSKNPNKYLGAGSHKKSLKEKIEVIQSQEQQLPPRTPEKDEFEHNSGSRTKRPEPSSPRTPRRTPQKRLSKFSPFKKSPSKSPRKQVIAEPIESNNVDQFIDFYDRTFEKVIMVSVIQMKEWHEKQELKDYLVDLDILKRFCSLTPGAKNIYVRLVNRKHAWLKVDSLVEKYSRNGSDIKDDLEVLKKAKVLNSDYENEDLLTLLNLLQVVELKELCKDLKLATTQTKTELIKLIYKFAKQQRSLFGGDCEKEVKGKLQKILGKCVKLADDARDAFLACTVLVTFPFYYEFTDEVARLNDYVSRIVRTIKNEIRFPSYELRRTCVFKNKRSFQQYLAAFRLCAEIEIEASCKGQQLIPLLKKALDLLKETLEDQKAMTEIQSHPIYLRRYSAGACLIKILYSKISHMKREDPAMAIDALTALVSQIYFDEHKKGAWFETLAQTYQIQMKDNNRAADILLLAFEKLQRKEDEQEEQRRNKLTEDERKLVEERPRKMLKECSYIKHALIERSLTLIGRQKGKIDEEKAQALKKCILDIDDNLTQAKVVTLHGKLMPNMKGRKQVYENRRADGSTLYSSVEEIATTHFFSQGFTNFRHDEGSTLKSILFALMWDIIYCTPSHSNLYGVFHSPYQEHPLDWRTPNFYERRSKLIMKKLSEIKQMTPSEIISKVMEVEAIHVNEQSVISNWNVLSRENVNLLTTFVTCVGVPLLVNIGEYIIKDVANNCKGFPDLTMWNTAESKCIFVEVKSLNDILSVAQKVWIHKLNSWGANVFVAHLKPFDGHSNN